MHFGYNNTNVGIMDGMDGMSEVGVQSRFAETRFAETLSLTLTLISAKRVSANREDTMSDNWSI